MKKLSYICFLAILALVIMTTACKKETEISDKVEEIDKEISKPSVLAAYRFNKSLKDSKGKNDSIKMTNPVFDKGGIYSTGKYIYSGDPGEPITTPIINNFNPKSFSVSVDFYVDELPGQQGQPVIMGGEGCRWVGAYLNKDQTVTLFLNNWKDNVSTTHTYALSKWHTFLISYDGTTAKLYLDKKLVASKEVTLNFDSCGNTDAKFTTTNFSSGQVLKGYIKNLLIYNTVEIPLN